MLKYQAPTNSITLPSHHHERRHEPPYLEVTSQLVAVTHRGWGWFPVPGSHTPYGSAGTGNWIVSRELDETVAVIGQFEDTAVDEGRDGEGDGLGARGGSALGQAI